MDHQSFLSKVDTFVEAVLSSKDIVGLSLTVIKGNETILTKGYGKINIDSENEVNEHTMFGACSNTKAFTSLLHGMVLRDNGWVPLHKDIS